MVYKVYKQLENRVSTKRIINGKRMGWKTDWKTLNLNSRINRC